MRKLTSIVFLAACSVGCSDSCQNTAVQTVAAPTGQQKAVLFERNCGATTGFTTQVSLLEANEEVSGKGNVFIADGGMKAASWGGPWAEVVWLSPKQLLIRYDASARVFEQQNNADGISISFEKVTR